MIYLIQILKMIHKENKENIELFEGLFSDISFEVDELGYKGNECLLFNDMLINHFGLELENEFQLKEFTKCVLDKRKFELSLKTFNLI